ncbi:TPA: hypothetical protein ACF9Z3_001385 [Legionella pneumophila]
MKLTTGLPVVVIHIKLWFVHFPNFKRDAEKQVINELSQGNDTGRE